MSKYNLGSGLSYKKGYINVDIDEKVNPDVVADVRIIPWIWAKPNSAERIEKCVLSTDIVLPFPEVGLLILYMTMVIYLILKTSIPRTILNWADELGIGGEVWRSV